jgi:hypothetical protein
MNRLTAYLIVSALVLGCPRPLPDPGTVIVSCTMDAVKDPKVVQAVMNALGQPNFAAALAALISPALGITSEVIGCILHSYMAKAGADPGQPELRQRAREYLKSHGYEVP